MWTYHGLCILKSPANNMEHKRFKLEIGIAPLTRSHCTAQWWVLTKGQCKHWNTWSCNGTSCWCEIGSCDINHQWHPFFLCSLSCSKKDRYLGRQYLKCIYLLKYYIQVIQSKNWWVEIFQWVGVTDKFSNSFIHISLPTQIHFTQHPGRFSDEKLESDLVAMHTHYAHSAIQLWEHTYMYIRMQLRKIETNLASVKDRWQPNNSSHLTRGWRWKYILAMNTWPP